VKSGNTPVACHAADLYVNCRLLPTTRGVASRAPSHSRLDPRRSRRAKSCVFNAFQSRRWIVAAAHALPSSWRARIERPRQRRRAAAGGRTWVFVNPLFKEDSMFRTALTVAVVAAAVVLTPAVVSAQDKPAGSRAAAKPASSTPVNINTASAAELEGLPGIGAAMAARIVEYRHKNGPFKKIEDLMNVRGLGEKNFLKLRPQLTLAAAKTDHDRQD
jgi:comEA protein